MRRLDGDPGGVQRDWQYRKVSIAQARAIAAARAAGVSAGALACEYGVSARTIYRAVRAAEVASVVVRVGDWRAEFILTADGPVRTTSWFAAEVPA